MKRNTIKAGFIQFNPVLGDKERNMSLLSPLIGDGCEAELLVIPELANSGYNFESEEQARDLAEHTGNSDFVEFLSDHALKHKLFLVAGILEEDRGKLYNSAILVGPGGLIGTYRKIHLFWNEFDFFERGNLGLPVFNLGSFRIGILICFDWLFPEVWRILALKGADVICHPSNLVLPYAQQAVPVHGLTNKTFNITANRFGTERGITFSGQSIISNTSGETVLKAEASENAVMWAQLDISLARDKKITPRNDVLADRSPIDYLELIRIK